MSNSSSPLAGMSALKLALTVQRLRAKSGGIAVLNAEPIAVIGIGCRFPGGANGPDGYWKLLESGTDAITEVPRDRWDAGAYYDANPDASGKTYARWGGFLESADTFDPQFFGISPREATSMDPQQRLLLEVSWEALEHAGHVPSQLEGTRTGVFFGMTSTEYAQIHQGIDFVDDPYAGTGNALSVGSGRVSYVLGLRGPNMVVDTACASSLVAVHLACQSLHAEECSLALAGGVNLMFSPGAAMYLGKLRAMAKDGRCKTFDAAADGYVRGEGCGVVVLKRLSDALADRDRILALVRGSAVNHDGRSSGLTVPNGPAQQALIRRALESAGIEPARIGYVEAHGTGTSLGDPIEMGALAATVGAGRSDGRPFHVGSVKTNIGHLEAAAGIAGFIKVVLSLANEKIPPHLHFHALNPHIQLEGTPLAVPRALIAWPRASETRCAGVSSFSLSGTNAHAILEEAPTLEEGPRRTTESRDELLPLSAKSAEALRAQAHAYRDHLRDPERGGRDALADITYTAGVRREHHDHRLAVHGATHEAIAARLDAWAKGETTSGVRGERPRAVFIFPGQGSQWLGMGRGLMTAEPVFADAMKSCDAAMRPHLDEPILDVLRSGALGSRSGELGCPQDWERAEIAQPALFAMAVSLASLWRSWGVTPDAVVGHSMGEIAAAHVAGILGLDEAARVVCRRSRLLRKAAGKGAMALVELSLGEARSVLTGYEDNVAIAASNSGRATILSGDRSALETILERLRGREVFCRFVKVDFASHSPQMDALRDELLRELGTLHPAQARVRFESTVRQARLEGRELTAAYWAENLREPVYFAGTIRRLREEGFDTFVEMSPHPILLPSIAEGLTEIGQPGAMIASLRRNEPERATMLASAAQLFTAGFSIDFGAVTGEGGCVPLPTYPFQRQRYWMPEPKEPSLHLAKGSSREDRAHPLLGSHVALSVPHGSHLFNKSLGLKDAPFLADHRVNDVAILPATAYLELALSAATRFLGEGVPVVEQVKLRRALPLDDERVELQCLAVPDGGGAFTFHVSSRPAETPSAPWTEHATATLRATTDPTNDVQDVEAVRARCTQVVGPEEFYVALEPRGVAYGPAFRGVDLLFRCEGEALGRLRTTDIVRAEAGRYRGHPAFVDAALQALAAAALGAAGEGGPYVPVSIRRFALAGPIENVAWSHATVAPEPGTNHLVGDVAMLAADGRVLGRVVGVTMQPLDARGATRDLLEDGAFELAWVAKESPPAKTGPRPDPSWLVLADRGGLGETLAARLKTSGAKVTLVFASDPRDLLKAEIIASEPTGIVILWSLDIAERDVSAAPDMACLGVMSIVQALAQAGLRNAPRLWLVTAGAYDRASPRTHQAPLWGLGRALSLEQPELRNTRVDLSTTPEHDIDALLREIESDSTEDQVTLGPEGRHVARLVRWSPDANRERPCVALGSVDCRMEIDTPGVLDRLALHEVEVPPPGPHEVQIAVRTAALNFNDVMKAMGIYPGLPDGPVPLGGECVGTVTALGGEVEGLRMGDDVVAIAPWAFGSVVNTPAMFAVRKPSALSAEGASATVAFMTAWYALSRLAHLGRGERVLVHSATGGVGLAALQIARHLGAQVFATAGSPEKRAFLRSLGIEHVMDSRSLAFADEILAATNGRGVDVVLNSLSGGAMRKSLEVLAPYGRFLELGKRDIYEDNPIGLYPFHKNTSYFAIDLARMFAERPLDCRSLLSEVMDRFESGAFSPIETSIFPVSQAPSAFRQMAQAKHIGKIVLSFDDPEAQVIARPADRVRADATYLVTGGLGGLGLVTARWLAQRGARHLVLVGRSAPSSEAEAAIASLRSEGVRVTVASIDVAEREPLARLLDAIRKEGPALRGVIHSAGAIDDGMLAQMTVDRFAAVWRPKVLGAAHLDALTEDDPLDFFVLYSSGASLLGSPGQCNYAAASAYLDALAHRRRREGRVALAINWGPWAEVGLAAREAKRGARLSFRGVLSLTPEEGTQALERLLECDATHVAIMPFDLRQWRQFYPRAAESPLLADLLGLEGERGERGENGRARKAPMRLTLTAAEPAQRRALLETHLVEQLAHVLGMSKTQIDATTPLKSLGLDSLMALELRNRLEASLGVALSATLAWGHPTVTALGKFLADKMELSMVMAMAGPADPAPSGDAPSAGAHDEVRGMTEEEAEAALAAELATLAEIGRA